MVQGVNKEYVFDSEQNIKYYLSILKQNSKKFQIELIAYCIMNNHAHFLVYTEDSKALGSFMHRVNFLYAQKYNKEKNRVGVVFRNRYKSEPIFNEKYLISCIKYIHENPVKAKMVLNCESYPYSSYNDYMHNVGATQTKTMSKKFGNNFDYKKAIENADARRFLDIENDSYELSKKYINDRILEYEKRNTITLADIYSNRDKLKSIIEFLKNDCKINYVEIREFLKIPRGTVNLLKN